MEVGKVAVKKVDTAAIATWELTCTGGLIGKTVSVDNIERKPRKKMNNAV